MTNHFSGVNDMVAYVLIILWRGARRVIDGKSKTPFMEYLEDALVVFSPVFV
jgi:hypothetical protein